MTSSNIDEVIRSIDKVKTDIRHEFRKRMSKQMEKIEQRAKRNVKLDADFSGRLRRSIDTERRGPLNSIEFAVGVSLSEAPYAAIVEFGSGANTNTPFEKSKKYGISGDLATLPSVGFPFDAPDIPHDEEDPYKLKGYPKFAAFVDHIEEWMKQKPVQPKSGDYFTSAVAIAAVIVEEGNYAHPYLRPAWFHQKPNIKMAARDALRNATR